MMIIIVDDMVWWYSGRNGQGGGFPGITDGGGTITRGYSKDGPSGGGSDSDGGLFSMIFGSNTNAASAALRQGHVWSILFTILLNWYFSNHRRWYWFKRFYYLFNRTEQGNTKKKYIYVHHTPVCKIVDIWWKYIQYFGALLIGWRNLFNTILALYFSLLILELALSSL